MFKSDLKYIVLTGILSGLAILFGFFVHFPLGSSNVSLVMIIIGIFPLLLPIRFSILATMVSVVLTDVLTGWLFFSWISLIAYTIFTLINIIAVKFKLLMPFILFIACLALLVSYFLIDLLVFGYSFAVQDLIGTSIQVSISFAILVPLLHFLKPIAKLLKIF